MPAVPITPLLDRAISAREPVFDSRHETALRLFNGFYEGFPTLAIDLYARTLVIHNYSDVPSKNEAIIHETLDFLLQRLPWVQTGILKNRNSDDLESRRGSIIHGSQPDRRVREHGVWYALELTMNRDASFYMDTRNLRKWIIENAQGKTVLNTFAYTGSLGVAATAGGAARVVHLDLNRSFLNIAKTSHTLNGFPISKSDFINADFWPQISKCNRVGARFDWVLLDPPFFASTGKGTIDLETNSKRLINKVRPLINNGGTLVAINNAVFVSGQEYMATLESLCADGYLGIETLIPVPADFTGYPETRTGTPITDPSPFNHATKIAILRVRRKATSRLNSE